MGTKAAPGAYDCYAKAATDEPLFTLLARDRLASDLVHLWAALRERDYYAATVAFGALVEAAAGLPETSEAQIDEADRCARDMVRWREERARVARGLPPSLAVSPNIPWERQTLDQLRAERDYWVAQVRAATGFASAKNADDNRRACEAWIARRERAAAED